MVVENETLEIARIIQWKGRKEQQNVTCVWRYQWKGHKEYEQIQGKEIVSWKKSRDIKCKRTRQKSMAPFHT